ncbi:MAG: SdpI family protein [Planctomycetes bacterium]|nr:SdpI family protein [Planctomycetota bacterium]
MKIRFTTIMMVLFILCMFGFSVYYYPKLPHWMASHWNARGQVDGHMSKNICVFMIPAISVFVVLLFAGLSHVDPLQKNFRRFRVFNDTFLFLLLAFLFAVQVFIIAWNLGIKIRINFMMPVLLSILFFGLGCIMEKVGPNWFIGIRTPWTLSNERVWRKTHLCSAVLFKLAAAVMLFGGMMIYHPVLFIIVPVLSAVLISVFLSYVFYRQENRLHL